MSERTYIIALDGLDPVVDSAEIKNFIKANDRDFKNWWNHIPYVFLVTSEMSADAIAERLKPFSHGSSFVVMEVNPANSEGWLSERAWNWIRKRSPSRASELLSRLSES